MLKGEEMIKIKIEITVPDNDCDMCDNAYVFNRHEGKVCTAFDGVSLTIGENGKYQRCEECIKATV